MLIALSLELSLPLTVTSIWNISSSAGDVVNGVPLSEVGFDGSICPTELLFNFIYV